MISSFCGTIGLLGGTTVKPRNMNTRIKAALSTRLRSKQTNTRSHSSFCSANSSSEIKLSREPSGKQLAGICTYKLPCKKSVRHSTSFSSLNGHLKSNKIASGFSAISSKSTNSFVIFRRSLTLLAAAADPAATALATDLLFNMRPLCWGDERADDVDDDDEDEDDDEDAVESLRRGLMSRFRLTTLTPPLVIVLVFSSSISMICCILLLFVVVDDCC